MFLQVNNEDFVILMLII